MRVLVTGAAGFLGSHLVERLLQRGDEVVGLDSFDPFYDPALKRANLAVRALAAPRFRLVEGDLLDDAPLADAFAPKPDAVVHLAALAGVRPSVSRPERYARVNVEGTSRVLEAARRVGCRAIVFASSSSVYGARAQVPFREEDPAADPESPYAATKRAGELLCSVHAHLHGAHAIALRFFTAYGPRQRPEMAIARFVAKLYAGEPIPLYGDGSAQRDFTYVDDVVRAVVAAADRAYASSAARYEVFNVGGAATITMEKLIAELSRATGQVAHVERHPAQPGDVPITYADVAHAGRELGFAPQVPLVEGLARYVRWLRAGQR